MDNNKDKELQHDLNNFLNDKKNCESYQGFGDTVLEVSGGFCEEQGIKKGDNVSFSLF